MKIFVFGSNLAGLHGAGSAKEAFENWDAKWGVGVGRTGNAYAIPTKDHKIKKMSLNDIKPYIRDFISYAETHSELKFHVVKIGCGLAGFNEEQIKPLFANSPNNCILPEGWR